MGIQKNRRALALDFLRQGVSDIIEAPWSFEDLVFHIRKHQAQPTRRLTRGISELGFDGIVGRSKEISAVFDTIARVAPFDTTLLITGSSGTGKELVAQAIHRNSKRKNKPFVAINCGAIPEHLIESELFGHKKGAFTDALYDKKGLFEEANGGTIFLDEIAELSPQLQVKLLRVLQERSFQAVGDSQVRNVDVRVVAATLSD
ncbi:MAG: sigma-54 factor interaction domain-containing protein, partial [Bdellovibrionales bacterium]|nr:sigma-54 factor interaction domain-containing protein [Bdellovibrionales bacterium]